MDELSLRTVRWAGFDPDLCRAAAAAVFDRPEKVTLIPFMSKDCFTALQADEVDLLSQTAACTGQGAAKEFDIADFVLNHEAVIFRAGEKAVDASHRRDASGHRRTGFATRWMKSSTPQEPVVLSGTISKGPAALSPLSGRISAGCPVSREISVRRWVSIAIGPIVFRTMSAIMVNLFERSPGRGSPPKIERDQNAPWPRTGPHDVALIG